MPRLTDRKRAHYARLILDCPTVSENARNFARFVLETCADQPVATIPETGRKLADWRAVTDLYHAAGYESADEDEVRTLAHLGCGLRQADGVTVHIRPTDAVDWLPLPALRTFWSRSDGALAKRVPPSPKDLPTIDIALSNPRLEALVRRFALDCPLDELDLVGLACALEDATDATTLVDALSNPFERSNLRALGRWLALTLGYEGDVPPTYRPALTITDAGPKAFEMAPGRDPNEPAPRLRPPADAVERVAWLCGIAPGLARRCLKARGTLPVAGLDIELPRALLASEIKLARALPYPRSPEAREKSKKTSPIEVHHLYQRYRGDERAWVGYDVDTGGLVVIPSTPIVAVAADGSTAEMPLIEDTDDVRALASAKGLKVTVSDPVSKRRRPSIQSWWLVRRRLSANGSDDVYGIDDARGRAGNSRCDLSHITKHVLDTEAFARDVVTLHLKEACVPTANAEAAKRFAERWNAVATTSAIDVVATHVMRVDDRARNFLRWALHRPRPKKDRDLPPRMFMGANLTDQQREALADGQTVTIRRRLVPQRDWFYFEVSYEADASGAHQLVARPA